MPPKRSNPSGSADAERPAKKAATGTTKAAGPKLKKSTAPNWYQNSEYSRDKPATEWGKKCVDRWCLLPPYNTSISEKQWKTYYLERSALDKVNSKGSEESKEIVSEELGQDTWVILRRAAGNIAAGIYGSSLDEETKKAIGRTLLGSLYLTDLWGNDEGDGSPREVCAKTRLYSPFGLGTSIDFYYRYYYRVFSIGQRFSSLYAIAKTVSDCNAENPRACTATKLNANQVEKAAPDAITLFDRNNKKSKGTTPANIKTFEEPLFGCEGWLSPLKLVNILFAAGTVLHYKESDRETPRSVSAKLHFFQGESDGQSMLKQDLVKLKELEADQGGGEVCVPQILLLLARQEETAEAGPK